jgi:long-chain acyl-CoA synthetase
MEGEEMDRVWYKNYDPRVPHTIDCPEECLPLLVQKNAIDHPRTVATEFFGAKLTYDSLWTQILSFANALSSLGVKPGTKVAIMLPNCPQTIIAYYATLWLGGVVVMTNPLYVEREIEFQWGDAEAEFAIVLDHLYPRVERVLPQLGIQKVIVTSLREYLPLLLKCLYPLKARQKKLFTAVPYSEEILNFWQLVRKHVPHPLPFAGTMNGLAALQYTGGTTGTPKGVMLTHRNLLSNVIQLEAWVPDLLRGKERFLGILPFFHVFGMTVAMNLTLYTGCTAILVPRFEVGEFLKILKKSKPTIFPGVPSIFVALVGDPRAGSYDLSSIRLCITGSAPMPVEVLRRFEELTGCIILEGFGLSEASPVTHANPVGGARKVGSIGIALPDTDCRIVDLDLGVEEKPPGEIGELVIRGPQVMQGYWKLPQETADTLRDGWLYTGDIARMDEEGYVFVVDRKKDMIISCGYNVYPREIDEVLYEHPKVLDAVAIGIPDLYRGEMVKAYVVLKPGEVVTEEEIIQFSKARLAAYKVPRSIEFRQSLPKSMVGKVFRKELRQEVLQHYEKPEGAGNAKDK